MRISGSAACLSLVSANVRLRVWARAPAGVKAPHRLIETIARGPEQGRFRELVLHKKSMKSQHGQDSRVGTHFVPHYMTQIYPEMGDPSESHSSQNMENVLFSKFSPRGTRTFPRRVPAAAHRLLPQGVPRQVPGFPHLGTPLSSCSQDGTDNMALYIDISTHQQIRRPQTDIASVSMSLCMSEAPRCYQQHTPTGRQCTSQPTGLDWVLELTKHRIFSSRVGISASHINIVCMNIFEGSMP